MHHPYATMSFRNQGAGSRVINAKTRTSEHQLKSQEKPSKTSIEKHNAMWRRTQHSSQNAYTTLPRKIHSTQSNHVAIGQSDIPDNSRRMVLSDLQATTNPRDRLYLPVSSTRNQNPPLPPLRGDSAGKKNSERRFSDITYADLSLNSQTQKDVDDVRNSNFHQTKQHVDAQATIAPLSEGVPAELRVTSPTTLYATIGVYIYKH